MSPACAACWAGVQRYDEASVASVPPAGLDWLRSLGPYDGSLRAILHALKYDGRQTLARRLGAELGTLLRDIGGSPRPIVVPVPLHRSKGLARGFNQAEVLARALGNGWPVRCVLARTHAAATQTRFDRAARRDNVAHVFRASTAMPGTCVVLVDDVVTTGATLSACADALRRAGATRVGAVTVARTEKRLSG